MQGFSTGLPERLQLALLHTLPGLEQVGAGYPVTAVIRLSRVNPNSLSLSLSRILNPHHEP